MLTTPSTAPHTRSTPRSLTRRRMLRSLGVAGLGVGAAALAGCAASPAASGAKTATQAGATPVANRGGGWRTAIANDPPTLDPYASISLNTKLAGAPVYSRLLAYEAGPDLPKANFNTVPDVAQSLEVPDAKTYILHLNPKATFHPPLSRALTADDVRFSFGRFMGTSAGTAAAGDAQLLSAVTAVEAPNARTVIFRLKEPYGAFAQVLADARGLQLMPRQTGRDFDPTKTMVGTGPWIFRDYRPGKAITYIRNPDWHLGPERPYLDTLEVAVIRDEAAATAEFLGGTLDTTGLNAAEIRKAQAALKGLAIVREDVASIHNITFSSLDAAGPWKDVRVRRAVSMSLDRDTMLDAAFGLKEMKALGIDAPYRWNGFLPWGLADYWLDPKAAMSPAQQAAFKYAPAEAAKLLDAAGFKDGFAADWHVTNGYRGGYPTNSDSVAKSLRAAKIILKPVVEDYASVFLPQTFAGNFRGLASLAYALGEPGNYLASLYLPGSPRNSGKVDDAKLTDLITRIQANPERESRRAQILEAQVYLIDTMPNVPLPNGPTFTGYRPNARNVMDFQSQGYAAAVDQTPQWWKA